MVSASECQLIARKLQLSQYPARAQDIGIFVTSRILSQNGFQADLSDFSIAQV
jgi:hypothetical protein